MYPRALRRLHHHINPSDVESVQVAQNKGGKESYGTIADVLDNSPFEEVPQVRHSYDVDDLDLDPETRWKLAESRSSNSVNQSFRER